MPRLSKITAFVDIDDDEESVEGNYFAGQYGHLMKQAPSDVVCPFCFGAMDLLSAPWLGRIVQQQGERRGGKVSALVELMPPSHEALLCGECDIILTRWKEGSEHEQEA